MENARKDASFGLRALLNGERQGVLATISARKSGWPFASVAPYALSVEGEPLLLLSDLAEHTRNLRADPRASLLIQDSASLADPQAGARATLLGRVELVAPDTADGALLGQVEPPTLDSAGGGQVELSASNSARARYLARHPQAAAYLHMADFRLFVLRVSEARFIGGFGDMGWLDGDRLAAALRES